MGAMMASLPWEYLPGETRNGEPATVWPEESIGQISILRGAYLSALKAADDGDYDALIALHVQYREEVA